MPQSFLFVRFTQGLFRELKSDTLGADMFLHQPFSFVINFHNMLHALEEAANQGDGNVLKKFCPRRIWITGGDWVYPGKREIGKYMGLKVGYGLNN